MSTPPNQPGRPKSNPPIEKQLDELLVQIEETEPGAIDPGVLPESYRMKPEAAEAGSETAEPTSAEAPVETVAEPEPAATTETTPEQADMLAALNSALQGISTDPPADETSEPDADAQATAPGPAEPTEARSMEEKLQQEIASLMDTPPQVAADASPDDAADGVDDLGGSFETPEQAAAYRSPPPAEDTPSTEDQIAMEIEGLLNADQPPSTADNEAEDESAIDALDKMLASEIDADDELAGDFQTVEDVTAGIQVEAGPPPGVDDEHAATAREVAAELDSQPEDLPHPSAKPASAQAPEEDPLEVLAEIAETAEQNEAEHQRQVALQTPDWQRWLATAKDRLFHACYVINYPARRLSAEWRANIGYIALLNLFFGVGLWIVLILF